jgi:hypothetical protein
MQTTKQKPDASAEAGTYAAGLAGQQANHDQQAFEAGASSYDAAHNVGHDGPESSVTMPKSAVTLVRNTQ